MQPSDDALPFALVEGWPSALPGNVVTMREAGIALGSLLLEDEEWHTMRSEPVYSLRIDDHPLVDGWMTRRADGSESTDEFEIPLSPVEVPSSALVHGRAFNDWVMSTHGASGRLLIWDEPRRWWMVNEPDLELVITCAPSGVFAEVSQDLSWLPPGDAQGKRELVALRLRYNLSGRA